MLQACFSVSSGVNILQAGWSCLSMLRHTSSCLSMLQHSSAYLIMFEHAVALWASWTFTVFISECLWTSWAFHSFSEHVQHFGVLLSIVGELLHNLACFATFQAFPCVQHFLSLFMASHRLPSTFTACLTPHIFCIITRVYHSLASLHLMPPPSFGGPTAHPSRCSTHVRSTFWIITNPFN